jgi:predicted SnoaL-like aldol condensation-catalyzing enzyme
LIMEKVFQLVVFVKNGEYVKEWQYSQGNFDVVTTPDLRFAENFGENPTLIFNKFFLDDGWAIEEWDLIARKQ